MDVSMPNHVVTAASTASHRKLRRQFSGKYYLTLQRNDWITHYYSDTPGVAVSEAWADKFARFSEQDEPEERPTSWCLIDSSEQDVVFFMSVRGDVVREARCLPFDELDRLKLKLGDRVYVAPGFSHHFPEEDVTTWGCHGVEWVEALEPSDYQSYQLKPNRLTVMALLGSGALLVAAVSGGLWAAHQQKAAKPVAPQVVDDYQGYRTAMRQGLSAGEVMDHVLSLTAKGTLAPFGWTLENVSLNGHDVVAVIKREEDGLRSTIKAWLEQQSADPTWQSRSTLTVESLTLTESLTFTLAEWTEEIAPYDVGDQLMDTFINLGWNMTGAKDVPAPFFRTLDMPLKKASVTLSEIQALMSMLTPLPVSIDAFALTPNEDGTYRIDMHIKFMGEHS